MAITPAETNKYAYEDGLFTGVFFVTDSRINFVIKNKTMHSMKIVWDEGAFIDPNGESGRLTHTGVRILGRNESQPPSVIPGGTSLSDFVVPASQIYYREASNGLYSSMPGGWEEAPLLLPAIGLNASPDSAWVETFSSEVRRNLGKRFGILLPLEIEGVVNEYTFWFEVKSATVLP